MNGWDRQWVGRAAVAGAILGVVLTPLHAMARHATPDGSADLALPLTRAWSEPMSEVVRALLDWSDPQTVYVTYGKAWVLVFGAAALCALAVARRRDPQGVEKWMWRAALAGYWLSTAAAFFTYWTPWWLDASFTMLGIPGLLLTVVGSTALGITLLRGRFTPPGTAWLLTLSLPLLLLLGQIVSFGGALMPIVLAWAIAGRHLNDLPDAPTRRAASQPHRKTTRHGHESTGSATATS